MPAEYWARQIGYDHGRDVKYELAWLADQEGWLIRDESSKGCLRWRKNFERHDYELRIYDYPEPDTRFLEHKTART